ncbi:hypothetical protein NMA58_08500 [Rhizobium sp. YTUHZ045]|uniref:hypothetical protein n=1 Tax=Rhizobium sp. YTUHZ045 TaxID=2962888 RepID=UPI003DA87B27
MAGIATRIANIRGLAKTVEKIVDRRPYPQARPGGSHPPWVPDPDRYMPAATRTRWPVNNTTNAWTFTTGLNYQCSKLFFGSPDYPTNTFLIPFVGFGLTEGGNAPQELQSPTADFFIDKAKFIHPITGIKYPITFSSLAAATITAGTGIVYGEVTLPSNLPAWTVYGVETYYHGTVGQTYVANYRIQRHRGEKYWAAGDLASVEALADADAPSTAAMDPDSLYNTVGNATNSQKMCYGPALILAKGWDGRPAPLVLADSLLERQEIAASADARGNMGVGRRWLDQRDSVWGSYIPVVMGVPGSKSAQELTTNAFKRWDLIDAIKTTFNGGKDIWTCVLDWSGRNDTNATVASTWANAKTALPGTRVRNRYGAGTHIVGVTMWPTVSSSSDSGRTVAGYSYSTTQWTSVLAAANALLLASSAYNKTIDVFPAFMSDTDPTKPPAAETFPLGNVIGHPGNQDGVTTWDTIKLPNSIPLGARIMFEYQVGSWASRTLIGKTDNGDGTADYKVQEVFATVVLNENAALLGHAYTASDFIHPALHHVLRTVSRIPQSEKLKLYP